MRHGGLVVLHGWLILSRGFSDEAEVLVREIAMRVWLPGITILAGALIGLLRPLDGGAAVASALFLGFSLVLFDARGLSAATLQWMVPLSGAMSLLVPALTLDFALRFPEPAPLDLRRPWLRGAAFAASALVWTAIFVAARNGGSLGPVASWATFLYVSLLYAISIAVLMDTAGRELRPDHRRRLRLIAVGTGVGIGALGLAAGAQRLGFAPLADRAGRPRHERLPLELRVRGGPPPGVRDRVHRATGAAVPAALARDDGPAGRGPRALRDLGLAGLRAAQALGGALRDPGGERRRRQHEGHHERAACR